MREIRTSGSTRGSNGAGDSRPLLSTLPFICGSHFLIEQDWPSRLLEFGHGGETGITTRHSGRAPCAAAGTAALRAGKPRGAVRT